MVDGRTDGAWVCVGVCVCGGEGVGVGVDLHVRLLSHSRLYISRVCARSLSWCGTGAQVYVFWPRLPPSPSKSGEIPDIMLNWAESQQKQRLTRIVLLVSAYLLWPVLSRGGTLCRAGRPRGGFSSI